MATRLSAPRTAAAALAAGLTLLGLLLSATPAARGQAPTATAMPDFQLRDANSSSPRANTVVSPRDYRLQISAYYFGDAG